MLGSAKGGFREYAFQITSDIPLARMFDYECAVGRSRQQSWKLLRAEWECFKCSLHVLPFLAWPSCAFPHLDGFVTDGELVGRSVRFDRDISLSNALNLRNDALYHCSRGLSLGSRTLAIHQMFAKRYVEASELGA